MPEMLIFRIMTKFEMLAKQWEDSILTPDEALLIVGGNSDGGAANNCRCNGNNCSCGGRANNCNCETSSTRGNNCMCGENLDTGESGETPPKENP